MNRPSTRSWLLLLTVVSTPALAHSFGRQYTPPVPLWLYGFGAAAALLLSFLIAAYFLSVPHASTHDRVARTWPGPRGLGTLVRGLGLALLLLTILSAALGPTDPYQNFAMSGFWIGFVLGVAYLAAMCGAGVQALNPWATLLRWPTAGRLQLPAGVGVYPALVLYLGFISLELFGATGPRQLALMLLVYTGLTLAAGWLFGGTAWRRQGEFFSILLDLLARHAPLQRAADGRWQWRMPGAALCRFAPRQPGLILFILALLASTAVDGLRETQHWIDLYWTQVYPEVVRPLLGLTAAQDFPALQALYRAWQIGLLWLAPVLWLLLYALAVWLSARLVPDGPAWTAQLRVYAYSLLPIALAYHVSHYWTLLLTQGAALVALSADPLGRGWGWHAFSLPAIIPEVGWVWHVQVGVILCGHIAGVVVAHLQALQLHGNPRRAALSQLPMLALMLAYTVAGLWILAQPLTLGAH